MRTLSEKGGAACAHAPLSRGPTTFPCYHLVEAREILTVQLCVNELTRDLSSDDLCMCVCDVYMCDGGRGPASSRPWSLSNNPYLQMSLGGHYTVDTRRRARSRRLRL